MKIEVEIMTISKGKVKQIKLDNIVYDLYEEGIIPQMKITEIKEQQENIKVMKPKQFEPLTRGRYAMIQDAGKRLAIISGVPIYEKILDKIKDLVLDKENIHKRKQAINILQAYHRINKKSGYKYTICYRNYINEVTPSEIEIKERPRINYELLRGKEIFHYGHTIIYENVLKDFQEATFHGRSILPVMKKYYPNVKKITHQNYASLYRKYMIEQIYNKKIDTKVTPQEKPIEQPQEQKKDDTSGMENQG